MPGQISTLTTAHGGEMAVERKVVLIPTREDFALIRGKVKSGMQMRCGGICGGTCYCKHSPGTNLRTRD